MYLHIKFDGHEIIATRPGTDMMNRVSQSAR